MAELFTADELTAQLREDVALAGGAKKWLRKNKVLGNDHLLHMVTDGRDAGRFFARSRFPQSGAL